MEFMNLSVITLVMTFLGVLTIGAFKAYERITNPGSPETWDTKKFGIFVFVVAVIMVIEYAANGVVEFPADELIQIGLTISTPIFGLFGLAYSTIIAGRLVKRDVVVPIVAGIKEEAAKKATTSPTSTTTNWLSLMVTPTETEGTSPVPVNFKLYGTMPTTDHPGIASVDIDWSDGTSQSVPLIRGEATVGHIFSFVKTDKYTGHMFYPVFKMNGSDGSVGYYNLDGKGVWVWVQAL